MSMEENSYKNVKNLTNDFSATIALTRDIPLSLTQLSNQSNEEKSSKNKNIFCLSSDESLKDKNQSVKGIYIFDFIHQRQKIMFEFSDKIEAKLSINDLYALRNVINRSLDRLNNFTINNDIVKETTQFHDINAKRLFFLLIFVYFVFYRLYFDIKNLYEMFFFKCIHFGRYSSFNAFISFINKRLIL